MSGATRPTGVTILAVLSLIGGIFSVLAGLLALMGGAMIGAAVGGSEGAAVGGLFFILAVISLATGILYIAFAYGAWTLKPWGWALGIIAALASLVLTAITIVTSGDMMAALTGSIISIAIAVVILFYLNQPNVKAAFGRAAA